MNELEQALLNFALLLLSTAGPVLIAFIVAWIKAKTDEIKANIKANLDDSQEAALDWAVKTAVNAAEQSGLVDVALNKKVVALEIAEALLKSRGIDIDLQSVSDAIEAAVWTELNSPASDVSKAAVFNKTVEAQPCEAEVVKSDTVSPN
jgi:hypothetical protein